MSHFTLQCVDRPDLPPLPITERLRAQLVYFMTPADTPGLPALGELDYFFRAEDVREWLDSGVFDLISPLDTANTTEVELTEEQETLFQWLADHGIQHVRVVDRG